MFLIKLHRLLCPFWKSHVLATWEFEELKTKWYCKYCELPKMPGAAYRKTRERQNG